jgi:hypothetical protein
MRPLREACSEGACPFRIGASVPLSPYIYIYIYNHCSLIINKTIIYKSIYTNLNTQKLECCHGPITQTQVLPNKEQKGCHSSMHICLVDFVNQ